MSDLSSGVHRMTAQAYHLETFGAPEPCLSASIAKLLIGQSPLHAWTAHAGLNPDFEQDYRDTFDLGSAVHTEVLGVGSEYATCPAEYLATNGAMSTKAAIAWKEEMRQAGITPVKESDFRKVKPIADAARARLGQMGIVIDPERSELTALATIDDVICKARPDNVPVEPVFIPDLRQKRHVILDIKTIEVATPAKCLAQVENLNYDLQCQWYQEVWKAATGEDRAFLFCFVEKSPPHEVCVVALLNEPGHSNDFAQDAAEKCAIARSTWRECLNENRWPGYPVGIVTIGARSWHRQAWQDTQQRAALSGRPTAGAIRQAAQWQSPN